MLLDGKRGRCKYLDSFFSGLYMAVKFLFPLFIAFHKIAALHGDKDCIVKAVIMEFRHSTQIVGVTVAFINPQNALFQSVGNLFHFVGGLFGR